MQGFKKGYHKVENVACRYRVPGCNGSMQWRCVQLEYLIGNSFLRTKTWMRGTGVKFVN